MSKLLLKITNQPGDMIVHRIVAGLSGKEYLFLFDQERQAYVYEPRDDFEIEDIFGLVALPNFPWRFAPIIADGDGIKPRASTPPPWITPDKYAEHTLDDLLGLCRDVGLAPKEAHDAAAVRAQLDAYFVGRAVGEKLASGAGSTVAVTTEEPPAPAPLPPPPETADAPAAAAPAPETLEV